MSRSYEVAILGPNSSFKTRTGRDIKDGIEGACLFPIGSIFRATAEKLEQYGVPSEAVSSPMVESVLHQLDTELVDDVVTVHNGDGTAFLHNNENGIRAADYSVNPIVQDRVLNHIRNLTRELEDRYQTIIFEGRRSSPNGLNLFLTAPTTVRTEIKKIECDVSHLSDEEIAAAIVRRDLQDFGKKVEPLRRPQAGYIIRRESVRDEEHRAIVRLGIDTINKLHEGQIQLPRRQIIYTYSPDEDVLRERIPTYR